MKKIKDKKSLIRNMTEKQVNAKSAGITLITLIITIIVLLVLTVVTINMLVGDNGLINKVKTSVGKYENTQEKENNTFIGYEKFIDNINGSRDISKTELTKLLKEIIEEEHIDTNPPGTVISYIVGTEPPTGYLKCDGSVYNISDYKTLADKIKNGLGKYDYWGGNGQTTFAVPNLQGEFLRGTGENAHINSIIGTNEGSGANVGKHQGATSLPYIGNYNNSTLYLNMYSSEENGGVGNYDVLASKTGTRYFRDIGISISSNSSRTVQTIRPTNTSVLYCIKY